MSKTAPTPMTAEQHDIKLFKDLGKITRKSKVQLEFLAMDELKIAGEEYDTVYYDALKKLIRAEFRANNAKIKAVGVITKRDDAQSKIWLAQKERTHLLCDLGGLVVKAGLDKIDREVLAGMISNMKASYDIVMKDLGVPDKAVTAQQRLDSYKAKGKAFLNQEA